MLKHNLCIKCLCYENQIAQNKRADIKTVNYIFLVSCLSEKSILFNHGLICPSEVHAWQALQAE